MSTSEIAFTTLKQFEQFLDIYTKEGSGCHLMFVGSDRGEYDMTSWLKANHPTIPLMYSQVPPSSYSVELLATDYMDHWGDEVGKQTVFCSLSNTEYYFLLHSPRGRPMISRFHVLYFSDEVFKPQA